MADVCNKSLISVTSIMPSLTANFFSIFIHCWFIALLVFRENEVHV